MPAKPKALPPAPDPKRVNLSAEKLVSQALDLLASEGDTTLYANPLYSGSNQSSPDTVRSAGIPFVRGKTMLDAQKFRVNWYGCERRTLGKIARLVCERNWFASSVLKINKGLYGSGFRFADPAAQAWAATGSYPFKKLHDDLLEEWLVSDAVVAFWRTDSDPGVLPFIEVPDLESVDYSTIGGVPRIEVTVVRNPKIDPALRSVIGDKMWDSIHTGKRLVIVKDDPSSGYDFAVMKSGKSSRPIQAPSITSILDDLDFVEAVRVGDWNGAWSRREIIRHTKKGFGVSSGPNAGTARGNAKYAEIQAILKQMRNILGKTDVATNFDQNIEWLTFPKDFFEPAMLDAALQRLLFWGGLAAILLLKTDSQITGLSGFLTDRVRSQVESFRSDFSSFLSEIFNSPSFKKNFPDAPDLTPAWSVKQLYTGEALVKLSTFFSTYATVSPQTIREMFGVSDALESARLQNAHTRPDDFTPPYEPRQGLLPQQFPEAYPGASAPSAAPASNSPIPASPGRPTKE